MVVVRYLVNPKTKMKNSFEASKRGRSEIHAWLAYYMLSIASLITANLLVVSGNLVSHEPQGDLHKWYARILACIVSPLVLVRIRSNPPP
jgi:hypothetical protein